MIESWVTLTDGDVAAELTPGERKGLEAVLGGNQLGTIVRNTVDEIRGFVLAGGYALGDEGTVPAALKSDAVAVARWRLLVAVPNNGAMQSENRKEAYDRAMKKLDLVAQGKFALARPGTESGGGNAGPSFDRPTLNFDRQSQDGL